TAAPHRSRTPGPRDSTTGRPRASSARCSSMVSLLAPMKPVRPIQIWCPVPYVLANARALADYILRARYAQTAFFGRVGREWRSGGLLALDSVRHVHDHG